MNEFKEFLDKHRKIKLISNNIQYKFKTIDRIIYQNKSKKPCGHCGYGEKHVYVVRTNNNIDFVIDCWDGCLTFSEEVKITVFDEHLKDNSDSDSY
jgi:hypothetical protein